MIFFFFAFKSLFVFFPLQILAGIKHAVFFAKLISVDQGDMLCRIKFYMRPR